MNDRISGRERVRARNLAEVEVVRYRGDHGLWHKHIHNVDLDPVQVLKMVEMDRHSNTVDYSCRRTGKTAVKELWLLEYLATHADQELGIVAPREAQSLVNLNYHMESIRRSEVLSAWINWKNGRRQMADTYYQFGNRSIARSYGIMAQVDGGDLTAASLEEVDDMPRDRLFSRFLLMMGSTRRLGAASTSDNKPQIRITGVFKGADTLAEILASGTYHVLPKVDVYLGIELGILNAEFMAMMRAMLSPDEYIRQLLCINVAARNLIWEKWIRRAMMIGLQAGLSIAQPLPGATYKKRGLVTFGYDHSGHGEDPQSSKYAFVVLEQIGGFTCTIYARTWAPGTDEKVVKNDLKSYWHYFRPDAAIGDAYGIGMLTQLNDELYHEGLTQIDRRTIGEGQSTASTWQHWAFVPLRFEGMVKHSMATSLRAAYNNNQMAIAYFDDMHPQPDTEDMHLLVKQLPNIRPEQTKAGYATYTMANKKLGDDLFDATMAAYWALVTRGVVDAPAVVLARTQTREQLLGAAPKLPTAH